MRERQKQTHSARLLKQIASCGMRGPKDQPPGEWSQSLVNAWMPPGSHIHCDGVNGCRRATWWNRRTLSRSFQLWGHNEAALQCVQAAWHAYQHLRNMTCPIPGVLPHTENNSEQNVPVVAPKDKSKGKGKGRGRTQQLHVFLLCAAFSSCATTG